MSKEVEVLAAFSHLFRYAVPALKTLGGKIMNSHITRNVGKTLHESCYAGRS